MYKIPEFPLTAALWTNGANIDTDLPRELVPCNVAFGRRAQVGYVLVDEQDSGGMAQILFPAGTDVRDTHSTTGADYVEAPAGSGRVYRAHYVNDSGQGFENEHRFALCIKYANWPTPLPAVGVAPPPARAGEGVERGDG